MRRSFAGFGVPNNPVFPNEYFFDQQDEADKERITVFLGTFGNIIKNPDFLAEKRILCYNIGKLLKYERFT